MGIKGWLWFQKCSGVSFLLFTRCEWVQPEYISKRLVTSQQHGWCWLFGDIGSPCGLSSDYGKIDRSAGQDGAVLKLVWWLTLQRWTLPHYYFIPFFSSIFGTLAITTRSLSIFPRAQLPTSTGQKVSLPIYLVCGGYMKVDRNGARLPAWLHCRPAINFPGHLVRGGRQDSKVKARSMENQSKCWQIHYSKDDVQTTFSSSWYIKSKTLNVTYMLYVKYDQKHTVSGINTWQH